MNNINQPTIIDGFSFVDDRGVLSGCNSMDLGFLKRFYIIENHENRFIRAWHGHKFETKVFYCLSGSFLVGTVKIEDFDNPNPSTEARSFTLSFHKPQVLIVPGGFANGLMNLSSSSKLLVMSDKTLKESAEDDFRFDYNFWDVWSRNFR